MATLLSSLASPTRILALEALNGEGLAAVALYLSASTSSPIVVVRDPRPFSALDPALADLASRRPVAILDRVVPNPRSEDIGAMVEAARQAFGGQAPGLIIGIGGGSALDSAKALAFMLANPGDLDDYLGPSASRKPEAKGPKLALIPTTTGTGSEVTRFGVYTDRVGRKYTLASPLLQPDAALLVAAAVADIPPALLAATAYDAITHALETLWNRNATPVSDSLAHAALVELLRLAGPAYEARRGGETDGPTAALLAAACSAGVAFNVTGTAAIHALSFVLSEEWHQPHGVACAFFTDSVYSINSALPAIRAKLARVAREVARDAAHDDARSKPEDSAAKRSAAGEEAFSDDIRAAAWLGEKLVALRRSLGLASTFSDLGVGAAELPESRIASLFDKVQDDQKLKNNAVLIDAQSMRALVAAKLQ